MTKDESMLPVEILRQLVSLDSETGKMVWLPREVKYFHAAGNKTADQICRIWNKRLAGKPAINSKQGMGYLHGTIFNVKFLAHRVAYALHTGQWPLFTIDHIDGNKKNNRPSNLRDVQHKVNCRNQRIRINNTTGHTGIAFDKSRKKFVATVTIDFKTKHLGKFETFNEALSVRNAVYKANKFHQNHGSISV